MIRRAADEILLAAMHRVRRRVWWHRAIHAFLLVTLCWLFLAISALAADYWIRSDAAAARWLLTTVFVSACVFAVRTILLRLGPRSESLVDVASRIEQTHAELTGWLTSATAFAEDSDVPGQSTSLRELAIQRAVDRLEAVPESQWRRPAVPTAVIALFAALVALAVGCLVKFPHGDIGLRRLLLPWQEFSWPQRIELAFESLPSLVASGDSIEIEVVLKKGKQLPRDLVIERRIGGSAEIESTPVPTSRQESAKRTLMAGSTSFELRARGGDDQRMPWQSISVVPRASVASVNVLVHPPAYSRLPVEESGSVIESIRGATIEYHARTNVPIAAARLVDEHRQRIDVDVEISSDQLGITIAPNAKRPWKLLQRGQVGLELTDTRGLRSVAAKFDLRPRDDTPPHVRLSQPRDHAFATPVARLPIAGAWSDDFPDTTVSVSATLVSSPSEAKQDLLVESLLVSGPEQGMSLAGSIAGTVDLAKASARPGDHVVVTVVATDAAGQESPQVEQAVEIVDSVEWTRRWKERLDLLLTKLGDDARTVRSLRDVLVESEGAVGVRSTWNRSLQEGLEGAVAKWLPIVTAWERSDDGLLAAAGAASSAAHENHEENSPIGKLSQEFATLLERVHKESMTPLSEELFEASSLGTGAVDGPSAGQLEKLRKRLELALARVDLFLSQTAGVLARHAAEQESLQLRPALQKLLGQLHRLERGWASLALKGLRSADSDLEGANGDATQNTPLQNQLADQTRIARELWQQIRSRIEAIDSNRDDDESSEALKNFRRVRTIAEESPIDAWLAASLSLGRTKKATEAQQQVAKAIVAVESLLGVLSDSPETEFREKQEAMNKARQELSTLAAAQTEIVKRLQALTRRAPTEGETANIASEQKRVAGQLAKIDEAMDRSVVPQAASELDQARVRMNEAMAATGKSQFAQAWGAAQSARVRIEAAIEALADDELSAQRQRVGKTIEFLKASAGELLKRQSQVVTSLDPLPGETTLAELAANELELSEVTGQMAEQAKATPALAFTLVAAEEELRQASESLVAVATAPQGKAWAIRAKDRLQRLVNALAEASPEPEEPHNASPPEANTSENPEPKKPPQRLGPSRPEIAWLQLEQQVLQERTLELDRRRESGEPESGWSDELSALATQQEALFKIVDEWLTGPADRPEIAPGEKTPTPNSQPSKTPGKDPLGNLDDQLFPRSKKEGKK